MRLLRSLRQVFFPLVVFLICLYAFQVILMAWVVNG